MNRRIDAAPVAPPTPVAERAEGSPPLPPVPRARVPRLFRRYRRTTAYTGARLHMSGGESRPSAAGQGESGQVGEDECGEAVRRLHSAG